MQRIRRRFAIRRKQYGDPTCVVELRQYNHQHDRQRRGEKRARQSPDCAPDRQRKAEQECRAQRGTALVDYPRDLVEIIVVSDASTDTTDSIAESFAVHGVKLIRAPKGGKPDAPVRGDVSRNSSS